MSLGTGLMIEQKTSATATRVALAVAVALLSLFAFCVDTSGAQTKRVAVVGDIACPPYDPVTATSCQQAAVADRVAALRPDSLFIPGDVQYPKGEIENFRQSFAPTWGRFSKIWRPAPGNHEYATPGASGYYDFFGSAAGPGRRGYYSFDLGDWHVVSLNTNCKFVSCASRSAQGRWLKRDLARSRNKCVAAIAHHPLLSSGHHGNNKAVRPLFKQLRMARADLVFFGHDHHYERFAPVAETGRVDFRDGIRSFVVGTGGKSLYELEKILPQSRKAIADSFGVLDLRLSERGFIWRFVSVSGSVLDRGKARCR